jgi:hypothetical protein
MTGAISVTTPSGSAVSAEAFRVIGPLAVTPNGATLQAGSSVQFSVAGPGGYTPPADWAVEGVAGGNATVGTVSATGLYTAPTSVPQSRAMTVSVADRDDPTTMASVVVVVLPTGSTLLATATDVTASFQRQVVIVDTVRASASALVSPAPRSSAVATSLSASVGGAPAAVGSAAPVSSAFEPVITAVSPATIARGETNVTVTLTGAGFTDASAITARLDQSADTAITAVVSSISGDGTEASVVVSVAGNAAPGVRVMQITTPSGTSTTVNTTGNTFTVQ